MNLEEYGYNETIAGLIKENNLQSYCIGRVIAEHKERYIVITDRGELDAEITGNLRYSARSREDFPAVGDWVALTIYEPDLAIIHNVIPRFSAIARQAVGQFGELQLIATNLDYALLVQAVDRDYNINRLERYLTICFASKVSPIVVLTKIDLIDESRLMEITDSIKHRVEDIPVIAISNENRKGYDVLQSYIINGKTYCMLGSSGVGKSTLLNNLSGKNIMRTDEISQSTNKGKHVTSHRELVLLDNGGILIDNPGMREVGIVDQGQGLETTFDKIYRLAQNCRFKDCTHINETGCAVIEAVASGEIDQGSYNSYLKMEKEKAHFESTVVERHKKDKAFGKMLKDYNKVYGKNKK